MITSLLSALSLWGRRGPIYEKGYDELCLGMKVLMIRLDSFVDLSRYGKKCYIYFRQGIGRG